MSRFLPVFKAVNVKCASLLNCFCIMLAVIWFVLTVRLVFPTTLHSSITQRMSFVLIQSSSGEEWYLNFVFCWSVVSKNVTK